MWFSVELLKVHGFGINLHVFNRSECRNCCLYTIIQKIAPQAESGKYFQIWFFPRFGGKNGGVLSMRMQVILDSSFTRPGSAPTRGGKKGEFRDWTKSQFEWNNMDCKLRSVADLISLERNSIFCHTVAALTVWGLRVFFLWFVLLASIVLWRLLSHSWDLARAFTWLNIVGHLWNKTKPLWWLWDESDCSKTSNVITE